MVDLRRIVLDSKKFRDARKRAGLTQEAVALKVGVGKSAICKIEKGHVLPSANTLIRFCILVNASVPDLVARAARLN
jgi:DNA-binding XRE family transcriptional regulator